MHLLFFILLPIYVLVSSKVGAWTLYRRHPLLFERCPLGFYKKPIPYYCVSWGLFWLTLAVGILSSVNAFFVSGAMICSYCLSGIFVKILVSKAI